MAVPTFTNTGAKATVAATLPKEIFGLEVKNHELVKAAYVGYLANGRSNNAVTLKRGEVRGGGKKPWRQKGTGRARFGSSRNPIWRGGGIAFGPTGVENYSMGLSTESRRQSLRQALSLKNTAGAVSVIEKLTFKEAKTKEAAKLLDKLGANRNTVIVVAAPDANLAKVMNNLPNVMVITVSRLSTYQVMNADMLLIVSDAIASLTTRLGAKK
jgi:large subunit ribosomal protein L4